MKKYTMNGSNSLLRNFPLFVNERHFAFIVLGMDAKHVLGTLNNYLM